MAIETLIDGYVASGNTDALEDLRDVQRVPGQAGTELGQTNGRQIDQAVTQAQQRQTAIRTQTVKGIKDNMEQRLATASSLAERRVIVEQAAQQMRAAGAYTEARQTLNNFAALSQPGGVNINDARVLQAVTDGEITTKEQLDSMRAQQAISPKGYKDALTQLNTLQDNKVPNDPVINRQLDSYGDRFDSSFLTAVGIKKDVNGNYSVDPGLAETPIVSVGQAEVIREQARQDMVRLANEIRRTMPDASQQEQMKAIHTALSEWYRNNVETKAVRYVGDLAELSSITDLDERKRIQAAGRNRFRDLLASPVCCPPYVVLVR